MANRNQKSIKTENLFFRITPTAIFVLAGLFYLALPHELHVGLDLDFGASHSDHIVFGIVFLLMGGVIWYINGKKGKVD